MKKIKSNYIFSELSLFIPLKIKLKLLSISKYYQKKFNISLLHYQFYHEINIYINKDRKFSSDYFDYFINKFSKIIKEEFIENIILEKLDKVKNIYIKLNAYNEYTNKILEKNLNNVSLIFPINNQLENINFHYNKYKISSLIFKGNRTIFLNDFMVNKIIYFIYSDNIQKLVIKDCILSKENYYFKVLLQKLYSNQNLKLLDFSKNFQLMTFDKKYLNLFLLNNNIQNFKINLSSNSSKKTFNELRYFKTMKNLKQISIICDLDFHFEILKKLIFHSKNLKSITLSNIIISDSFDLSKFINLEEFSIINCQGKIYEFKIKSLLKKLKIKNVNIEEEILYKLLNNSKSSLEYFEFNQNFSNNKIPNCIYSLNKLKYLKTVKLDLPFILNKFNFHKIEELKIKFNEKINFPQNLKEIKILSLQNYNSINKNSLINILTFENLTKLSLKNIKLKGEIISILGNNLKKLKFLKSLKLNNNFDSLEEDINLKEKLLINLKFCNFLQILSIKNNNIDNKLLGILFFQFENMPILHKLDISNNIIDEFGISFFYLFPNYLKNLKKLFIKGNHLSSIQELEQKTNILYKLKNIIIIN